MNPVESLDALEAGKKKCKRGLTRSRKTGRCRKYVAPSKKRSSKKSKKRSKQSSKKSKKRSPSSMIKSARARAQSAVAARARARAAEFAAMAEPEFPELEGYASG